MLIAATSIGTEEVNIERVYHLAIAREDGPRTLRCRRVDTNLDGVFDLIRSYDDDGQPYREQADADLDGRIDTWVRFARGHVIEQRRDRNADGKPDELRIYSNGKLSRARRDSNYDGKVDVWEVYDGTHLHRMGVDLDADGRVDRWFREGHLAEAAKSESSSAGAADVPAATPSTTAEAEPAANGASPDQDEKSSAAGDGQAQEASTDPQGEQRPPTSPSPATMESKD